MQRTISDWGGNIAAFSLVILLNILSTVLPINNQTMPEISAKYPSLFTPAGFTFSIWGIIYLSLLLFTVFQALPSQRDNRLIARISPLFQVNCVANALWIVVWHYDLLLLSLLVMLVILATLVVIYRRLQTEIETASLAQHLLLYLPFSLYTGWITVATIANISVVQTANGWDDLVMSSVSWTLVKLAFAGSIGATMVLRFRDPVFILVVAWAAYGVSVMQVATPAVAGAAKTLALLALFLAAREGAARILRS